MAGEWPVWLMNWRAHAMPWCQERWLQAYDIIVMIIIIMIMISMITIFVSLVSIWFISLYHYIILPSCTTWSSLKATLDSADISEHSIGFNPTDIHRESSGGCPLPNLFQGVYLRSGIQTYQDPCYIPWNPGWLGILRYMMYIYIYQYGSSSHSLNNWLEFHFGSSTKKSRVHLDFQQEPERSPFCATHGTCAAIGGTGHTHFGTVEGQNSGSWWDGSKTAHGFEVYLLYDSRSRIYSHQLTYVCICILLYMYMYIYILCK